MNYQNDTYDWLPIKPNTFLNTNKYLGHVLRCKLKDSESADELRKCIFACTRFDYGRYSCDPDFEMDATSAIIDVVTSDIKDPESKFRQIMEDKGYVISSQEDFDVIYTALDDLSRASAFTKVNDNKEKEIYSHYIHDDILEDRIHEIKNSWK